MEGAVVNEQTIPDEQAKKEARIKRKIWMIYGGVVQDGVEPV